MNCLAITQFVLGEDSEFDVEFSECTRLGSYTRYVMNLVFRDQGSWLKVFASNAAGSSHQSSNRVVRALNLPRSVLSNMPPAPPPPPPANKRLSSTVSTEIVGAQESSSNSKRARFT